MPRCDLSIHVQAPLDAVFAAFTDFEHASERVPAIKRLEVITDGPVGVGTRFRETRVMFGKETTEEMEITRLEEGKTVAIACESCGALFETVFLFTPASGGTRVGQTTTCRAIWFFAKLMSPLSVLMMGSMKKMMLKDLEAIRDYCEGDGDGVIA